jgi:hypothetical protein
MAGAFTGFLCTAKTAFFMTHLLSSFSGKLSISFGE